MMALLASMEGYLTATCGMAKSHMAFSDRLRGDIGLADMNDNEHWKDESPRTYGLSY